MRVLLLLLMVASILLSAGTSWAAKPTPLEQRLTSWPEWQLPGPLPRPATHDDLIYPDWFEGLWDLESIDLDTPDDPPLAHQARFHRDANGRLVGDRSFNATSIGLALLGDQLLRVETDPSSANRQMAQFRNDQRLETSVTGRLQENHGNGSFLADELVLQIMRGPGPPRLSRIETLSRYERCGTDICAEQWQASYAPPGEDLRNKALYSHHYRLRLSPFKQDNQEAKTWQK